MQGILLLDDHIEARTLMKRLLSDAFPDAEVDEVASVQEARKRIGRRAYDLAVIDLSLPDGKGESLIDAIRLANTDCQIVVWSMHDRTNRLISVLAQGATGYLVKDQDEAALLKALKRLPYGEPALSASVTRRMIEHLQSHGIHHENGSADGAMAGVANEIESLTEREKQILQLLGKGFNRPDIAGLLNISNSTVATHSANIYSKLRVQSRVEAVTIAREYGLL